MKTYIRYIALGLLTIVTGSCEDEDKNPLPPFTRSSIPVFLQGDTDTGFINFLDFDASALSFNVDKLGTEEVTAVDVWLQFNNSQTGETETIEYTTVTSLPQAVTLSFSELVALFPHDVVTADTLSLGDSFVVGGNLQLADGRYLDGGYSPSVVANDPVYLTYNVACASDLAGSYDFTLVSGSDEEVASLPNEQIVEVAPGYYEISDISMDIFGGGFKVKYGFTDICGTLIADEESVDFGPQIAVTFNPGSSIDPLTGEITFDLQYTSSSCCGLAGLRTVFKATPR